MTCKEKCCMWSHIVGLVQHTLYFLYVIQSSHAGETTYWESLRPNLWLIGILRVLRLYSEEAQQCLKVVLVHNTLSHTHASFIAAFRLFTHVCAYASRALSSCSRRGDLGFPTIPPAPCSCPASTCWTTVAFSLRAHSNIALCSQNKTIYT